MKDTDVLADDTSRRRPHRPMRLVLILAAVVVVAAAAVLVALHLSSRDPGTAKRQPVGQGNDRRANSQIERRANAFVAALRSGDAGALRSLAYDDSDKAQAGPLITAFGNRADNAAAINVDDSGGSDGLLTIAVPCKNAPPQQIVIPFAWKRTSWLSSGWFAVIHPPGSSGLPQQGCPSP